MSKFKCSRCKIQSATRKDNSLPFRWRQIGERVYCNQCLSSFSVDGEAELGSKGVGYAGIPDREGGRVELNPLRCKMDRLQGNFEEPAESAAQLMARKRGQGKVIQAQL